MPLLLLLAMRQPGRRCRQVQGPLSLIELVSSRMTITSFHSAFHAGTGSPAGGGTGRLDGDPIHSTKELAVGSLSGFCLRVFRAVRAGSFPSGPVDLTAACPPAAAGGGWLIAVPVVGSQSGPKARRGFHRIRAPVLAPFFCPFPPPWTLMKSPATEPMPPDDDVRHTLKSPAG